jgi:hypothetical protein
MPDKNELIKTFRQQQEKYIYYVIALAVTAIGFSIYRTANMKLSMSQIPLALSVLFWGLSVFFGLRFIGRSLDIVSTNIGMFDVAEGKSELTGQNPYMIEHGISIMKEILKEKNEKISRCFNWQFRLFYLGVVSFIVWHIIEMYLFSIKN